MKKVFLLVLINSFLLISLTFASSGADIHSIINEIGRVLRGVFYAIAGVCFFFSGILFITAAGSEDQITKAKKVLIWGIVGVVVGIAASQAEAFVRSITGL